MLALLYPPKCVFCQALLDAPATEQICPSCRQVLPHCRDEQHFSFLSSCHAVFYYESLVREAILRYKFQDAAHYSRTLGHLLGDMLQQELAGQFDLITWVPVSRKRLRSRGYDQAQLLAQQASLVCGTKPVRLLKKIRNNPRQSSLQEPALRRANVQGVYTALQPAMTAGKRILLIDDVVTTGSTMSECARVLLTAGAEQVLGAALAAYRDDAAAGQEKTEKL